MSETFSCCLIFLCCVCVFVCVGVCVCICMCVCVFVGKNISPYDLKISGIPWLAHKQAVQPGIKQSCMAHFRQVVLQGSFLLIGPGQLHISPGQVFVSFGWRLDQTSQKCCHWNSYFSHRIMNVFGTSGLKKLVLIL